MNTKYTIKNFRVFDEQGATFELAPVTILTGCNSSGKSSITKSLMLLNPLISQYKNSIINDEFGTNVGFSSFDLDFTRGKHNLGNFERVINWDSRNKEFTVACEIYSDALLRPMTISFSFASLSDKKETQTLHARVRKVEISAEGKLFYSFIKSNDANIYEDRNAEAIFNLADWKEEIINILSIDSALEPLSNKIETIKNSHKSNQQKASELEPLYHYIEESGVIAALNAEKLFIEWCRKNIQKFNTTGTTQKFPYGHLFSLGALMDELNSVAKEDILHYAKERFIEAENIKNAWFNDEDYQKWIYNIFFEFVSSDFDKFSDYYSYYENFKLSKTYTHFGIKGSESTEYLVDNYIGTGTASPKSSGLRSMCFSFLGKQWSELTPLEKFQCVFYCLQGFGGYETKYSDSNSLMPEPLSLPKLNLIQHYATFVCEELIMKCNILTEAEFIELNRSNVQRIYSFDTQGTSFNAVLDTYYNIKDSILYGSLSTSECIKEYTKGTFSAHWLSELTDFSRFQLKQAPEGAGYYVYLKRKSSAKGKRIVSLADVGYGITPLISMLIRIEIAICKYLKSDATERVTICIEEPESNLHPAVQSKLADMFADASANYPVNFILETHSEYLVRKTQVLVAKMAKEKNWSEQELEEKNPFKVYYMPKPEVGKPYDMEYKLNGRFVREFASGFYDEAGELALNIF